MNKAIRILLVADYEVVRQGLRHMLEPEEDMEIVGDCANAEEAFSNVASLRPNMVLVDTQIPEMGGIEATHNLTRNALDCGAYVILLGESIHHLAEALEAGAVRYLLKDITRVELVQVIRQVYSEQVLVRGG